MPMTPFIGVRISWLMLARKSLFARVADSAASFAWRRSDSTSFCSVMSVLLPNQSVTRPCSSLTGSIRDRCHRNTPSCRLRGKVQSHGSPVAYDALMVSMTLGSSAGSWTDCHPHPCICSKVVPV